MAKSTTAQSIPPMVWGSAPELLGPRHTYRVDRLARCLAAGVQRGTILDAGCGAGTLTDRLLRMGYRVVAIDDSPEFVAHTQARAQRAGFADRLRAQRGDLQSIDLEPGTLDGIVCGDVLEHLPDDASAVRAMARALKPGGVLALTVPAGAASYDWLDAWAGHERRYDEPALRALLADADLRLEYLRRWGFPFMALYERLVQRPGLAHASRGAGSDSLVARLARSGPVTRGLSALFRLDELFEGASSRGTGFIARARKP
jgi:SAM-dependent methyltransferase